MIRLLKDITPCYVECRCGTSQLMWFDTWPRLRDDLEREGWRFFAVDNRIDHICPMCSGGGR